MSAPIKQRSWFRFGWLRGWSWTELAIVGLLWLLPIVPHVVGWRTWSWLAGLIALSGVNAIPGGTGHTIKDGVYELNIIGSKVHANGFTAPADSHVIFWALYGSGAGDANNITPSSSEVFVDSPDWSQFTITFGSESDLAGGSGQPYYNVALDSNLDGFIDSLDYGRFQANFGTDWTFSNVMPQ